MSTHEKFGTEIETSPCTFEFGDAQLVVSGELDMTNEYELSAALEMARRSDGATVVDMSGVSFMDSSALRAFVGYHASGNVLVVRHPSPTVARLFALTGVDEVFTIEPAEPR
jgi:anti-sigma B factor antagonist